MFSTKLRKTLAVVASATLLCTSLTACNRDSGGNNAAGDSANKSITFALSTQANSFMVKMREGAQKKADELGIAINGNLTTALCIYPNDEYKTTRRVTEQERQEI